MLKLCLKARLPLIAVNTRDTVNVVTVLEHVIGKKPKDITKITSIVDGDVYYWVRPGHSANVKAEYDALYGKLAKSHTSCILVNPKAITDEMFDLGELPIPKELKKKFLMELVSSSEKADALTKALGGCTIKESLEYALMTMARDHEITPAGLTKTRKSMFQGSQGLTQVDTTQVFYSPSKQLNAWATKKKKLFFDAPDQRLRPRGLLFGGIPGTGKTEGGKFLANLFGVPLFRLDISSTKNKYVGESSANLGNALRLIDAEEPCIVLIDEVEKVFATSTSDSSGVTTDMLSQVLWWLAEHKTRVLTIMTTNNMKKLPPELYREGRIDDTFDFVGLTHSEGITFASQLVKTFKLPNMDHEAVVAAAIQKAYNVLDTSGMVSHASLTEHVKDAIIEALGS